MKIWAKATSYREASGLPLTWMTSVARYHALDIIRSDNSARQREFRYASEAESSTPSIMKSLETDIVNGELLNKCLERLDPPIQEIIIDAYCGGYTHEELSQRANTPLGTVKSWIRRALTSLKGCIDELS